LNKAKFLHAEDEGRQGIPPHWLLYKDGARPELFPIINNLDNQLDATITVY